MPPLVSYHLFLFGSSGVARVGARGGAAAPGATFRGAKLTSQKKKIFRPLIQQKPRPWTPTTPTPAKKGGSIFFVHALREINTPHIINLLGIQKLERAPFVLLALGATTPSYAPVWVASGFDAEIWVATHTKKKHRNNKHFKACRSLRRECGKSPPPARCKDHLRHLRNIH